MQCPPFFWAEYGLSGNNLTVRFIITVGMSKATDACIVAVSEISKSFDGTLIVDNISFDVRQGEILGLVGPNGAGKTTTIRMMIDVMKPDSGEVNILGKRLSEATKYGFGYMPEERGLYKKLSVLESIVYLASLKGMDKHSATEKADKLLTQTGMLASKRKRIEELSKGMGY